MCCYCASRNNSSLESIISSQLTEEIGKNLWMSGSGVYPPAVKFKRMLWELASPRTVFLGGSLLASINQNPFGKQLVA